VVRFHLGQDLFGPLPLATLPCLFYAFFWVIGPLY